MVHEANAESRVKGENMAQKRIRMVQKDILADRIRLLYDDGTQGEIRLNKSLGVVKPEGLVGLTLKQAKMKLGIKK